ncbi:gamma-glutamyl-gamma-aminobutyrate hydrolase family protein [Ectothiorhodospira lacustris]|uniref:gamma-glutamyl-gamma-aminobutyrate hydrolase family protein n=1 Tax=Ectothiorhodospira lacustris TaxID=2899127 RepID=UPI001EE8EFEB|nr:gamma-glutamyl-gamma-aminobutyrate hydrolase family protein [Ectothiorhodospira lacustris]MCG5499323.1 gamma-glutamyl-gamma-aminobutyrate hydrolase family protein [Ectothiorhodospira lacustris]MCG5509212.1 gamma-glutamyl-gamma-aminobutyrate hydrolase family protein [Ectothiorhodospira lacustris]MCG5521002.1 gamma-glutamyl-gamma-aminobutyrate hydrolase family protein [Ectothiorhodospira lacustris]
MARKPRIGVTGPDQGGMAAWLMTAWCILRAGGRPVRITPTRPHDGSELDGLVIGGGADVDPGLYGQDPLSLMKEIEATERRGRQRLLGFVLYPLLWLLRRTLFTRLEGEDQGRDRLEEALIRMARERGLPLLGICRGMQLLNVVHGGTLHQELSGFYQECPQVRSILPRKQVVLEPGCRLAQLAGPTPLAVNALHNQAVDRLGTGVIIAAREPSGVVQAIEVGGEPMLIGVQWHPEFLPHKDRHQALFRGLVAAAGAGGP